MQLIIIKWILINLEIKFTLMFPVSNKTYNWIRLFNIQYPQIMPKFNPHKYTNETHLKKMTDIK